MALQSNGVVRRPEVGTGYRRARMADGGTIVLTFMTYCVEEYKAHKGLTGLQVEESFGRYGVFDYIEKHYDFLHTMGTEYIMNDIDEFIAKARSETKKK